MQASRSLWRPLKELSLMQDFLQGELGKPIPSREAVVIIYHFTNQRRLVNLRFVLWERCKGGATMEVLCMYLKNSSSCIKMLLVVFTHDDDVQIVCKSKHPAHERIPRVLDIREKKLLKQILNAPMLLMPPVHLRMACTRTCSASLQHCNHQSSRSSMHKDRDYARPYST